MHRLLRAAPNLFTLANLSCGVIALVFIVNHLSAVVSFLLMLSALFDFFDGKVARRLKVTSEFGVELDSLADLISFGVVPALAVYETVPNTIVSTFNLILFPIAGALRLARFNTHPTEGYFEGLPITAAGLIVGVLLWAPALISLLPFISIILALLMVSKIRIAKL